MLRSSSERLILFVQIFDARLSTSDERSAPPSHATWSNRNTQTQRQRERERERERRIQTVRLTALGLHLYADYDRYLHAQTVFKRYTLIYFMTYTNAAVFKT